VELLKRTCASKLDVKNDVYILNDTPFTGVGYFLDDTVYNGAYYIENGILLNKHHDAILSQHKDKQWVPWENIVSLYHDEVLAGTNYDLDEPYCEPYLYQGKRFTGIWVCVDDRSELGDDLYEIKAIEDGITIAELSIGDDGSICELYYSDKLLKIGETGHVYGKIMKPSYLSFVESKTSTVNNSIAISYKEEQVSSIRISNNILTTTMREIYNNGLIKRHYYEFDVENLPFKKYVQLSGIDIPKQQLQFLFATSDSRPKELRFIKLETLNKQALEYCKQELNMRCVDYYDTDY